MKLMDRYKNYYKPLLRTFCKNLVDQMPADDFHGIPHPFIPAWGTRYEQASVKMAFIGLETRGWNPMLPEYIKEIQDEQWESSFDISEFQNLDYVDWTAGKGTRYTFWGFVMYFLAALYGVEDWESLKQREHANILSSFLWGNVTAIERWDSNGISEGANPNAHQIARNAAHELNDFKHLQTIFSPDVSIIMCGTDPCDQFLRNTEKELLWCKDNVRLWKAGESFIFNMPHPNNMRWNNGADFYVKTIRDGLSEYGLFQHMPEFIDFDKEAEL